MAVDAVPEELIAEQDLGLVDRGLQGGDRVAGALGGGDWAGQAGLSPNAVRLAGFASTNSLVSMVKSRQKGP